MANQGRLIKVLFSLIVAMTMGALFLLALEGTPIKPMAYSLAGQVGAASPSIQHLLKTKAGVSLSPWRRIEVVYEKADYSVSESGPVGMFAMSYHFVITDGQSGQDGLIYVTDRWISQLSCLSGQDKPGQDQIIRICVIADPKSPDVSLPQARRLRELVSHLVEYCRIEPDRIQVG